MRIKPERTAPVCILLLFCLAIVAPVPGQDLLFFSDDHYKSLGEPELRASVAGPVLTAGRGTIALDLANAGELEELVAVNGSGKSDEIMQEMNEEMKSPDAFNITATILASWPLLSSVGPQHIASLPAGQAKRLVFNVTVDGSAAGWYDLPLHLEYERQVDASVRGSEVLPMLQAERREFTLRAYLDSDGLPLRVSAVSSGLTPGDSGTLLAAVACREAQTLHNCSARLVAADPFYSEGEAVMLGDIDPGELSVAGFAVQVDAGALPGEYQLSCELSCREKRITVPLPITLSSNGWPGGPALIALTPKLAGLVALALAISAVLLYRRGALSLRRKRRWQ